MSAVLVTAAGFVGVGALFQLAPDEAFCDYGKGLIVAGFTFALIALGGVQ